MAKAKRPVFVPQPNRYPFVREVLVEFEWFPGFALSQAQKSVDSLHHYAKNVGISPILEISSKSRLPLGIQLSAFNLMLKAADHSGKLISVECAFQGSKVFQKGGPYTDLYWKTSKETKQDPRLKESGKIIAFRYFGNDFPMQPVTAFYDRLYLHALWQNPELSSQLIGFEGFTDIRFNPEKSWNCQARSAALFVALTRNGQIKQAVTDREFYLRLMTNKMPQVEPPAQNDEQLKLF